MSSRTQKYLSSRMTTWSKYQPPSWWTLFTYCGLGALVLYMLFSALHAGPAVSSDAADARRALRSSPRPAVVSAPVGTPTTTLPTDGNLPAVSLPGPGGRPVAVPAAAAATAAASMRALYDPASAALVAVVGGGVLPDPGSRANGWVRNLTVVLYASPRLKVTALVDPDGAGPLAATTVYRTLLLQDTTWAVSPTE